MKSVKVLTSIERSKWVARDPEGYFAFVREEAARDARRSRIVREQAVRRPSLLTRLRAWWTR